MEKWLLAGATVLAVLGGGLGIRAVQHGRHSPWTLVCMACAFVLQLGFLGIRGRQHGSCPLNDFGEILAFLAWSLVLFYLLIGPVYRLSLLGLFTAPVVAVFQLIALFPGVLQEVTESVGVLDPWREAHAAFSILSYGSFALATVSGLMFLVLNRQLKGHQFGTGLFRGLPPVRSLSACVVRLTGFGVLILSVGILSGFLMEADGGGAHFVAAMGTWAAYLVLLGWYFWRGIAPKHMALAVMTVFILSLLVIVFV